MPQVWIIRAVAAAALLAGLVAGVLLLQQRERRLGAAECRAAASADALARERVAGAMHAHNEHLTAALDASVSARHAAIAAALNRPRLEVDHALAQPPVECPATVGAAVVPGAVGVRLNGTRHAASASSP